VLKAPGNNNTLNYFGPDGVQVTKGNGRKRHVVNPTICKFSGARW